MHAPAPGIEIPEPSLQDFKKTFDSKSILSHLI
jgi:hypothetical protein